MIPLATLRKVIVDPQSSILDAIKAIDAGNIQAVLVAGSDDVLRGVITDGDVRRGLLKGETLQSPVAGIMNTKPVTLRAPASREDALAQMRRSAVRQVPVLDESGRITGLHLMEGDSATEGHGDAPWVVIMAGGRGTRLHPLTETTPKPMLPVGGQPLLETIIRALVTQGFSRIYLSLNYMAEVFRKHFGDGSRFGADIRYIEESERLGTAGALSLLPEQPERPFLVMNGDLLTQVDFRNLLAYHAEHQAQATMCVRDYSVQIPYGVVELDGHQVTALVEKPRRSFFVNAGIYILDPGLLKHIPASTYFDMPQLIDAALAGGGKVASFPLHEYWLDIGRFDDLEQARAEFQRWFTT